VARWSGLDERGAHDRWARVPGFDAELAGAEAVFVDLAERRDLKGLRHAAGHFRNLARADGSEPPSGRDGVTISNAYDGTWVVHGEVSDLAAETVVTALHAYTEPPSGDDARSPAHRRAGALVRICEVALAHADDPGGPARARAHAVMVLDDTTLTEGRVGRLDGQYSGPIHPADLRRMLCDCAVSRVVTGPDSQPLDVGRSTRTVPKPLRRALVVRDQGCRFPGCDRPPGWCDAHHVQPWVDGGPTALTNLVLSCNRHHHTIHQPGWHADFDSTHLHITRPDGTPLADDP
jgi:Domain of unknown function (DUF222)